MFANLSEVLWKWQEEKDVLWEGNSERSIFRSECLAGNRRASCRKLLWSWHSSSCRAWLSSGPTLSFHSVLCTLLPIHPLLCSRSLSGSLGPKCEFSVLLCLTIHAVFATQSPLPLELMSALDRENCSANSVVPQTPTTDSLWAEEMNLQLEYRVCDQSCPTLCDPHGLYPTRLLCPGILQARKLGWWPFPPPGDLPNPGIEPVSLGLLHWQSSSLPLVPPGQQLVWLTPILLPNCLRRMKSESCLWKLARDIKRYMFYSFKDYTA